MTGCLTGCGGETQAAAGAGGGAVLEMYREKYFDFNVRHFHEKLREEHGIYLNYTWVKLAL